MTADLVQDVLDTLGNGEFLDRDSFGFSVDFTFNKLPMRLSWAEGAIFDVRILQTERAARFSAEPGNPPRIEWLTQPDEDIQVAMDVMVAFCLRMYQAVGAPQGGGDAGTGPG